MKKRYIIILVAFLGDLLCQETFIANFVTQKECRELKNSKIIRGRSFRAFLFENYIDLNEHSIDFAFNHHTDRFEHYKYPSFYVFADQLSCSSHLKFDNFEEQFSHLAHIMPECEKDQEEVHHELEHPEGHHELDQNEHLEVHDLYFSSMKTNLMILFNVECDRELYFVTSERVTKRMLDNLRLSKEVLKAKGVKIVHIISFYDKMRNFEQGPLDNVLKSVDLEMKDIKELEDDSFRRMLNTFDEQVKEISENELGEILNMDKYNVPVPFGRHQIIPLNGEEEAKIFAELDRKIDDKVQIESAKEHKLPAEEHNSQNHPSSQVEHADANHEPDNPKNESKKEDAFADELSTSDPHPWLPALVGGIFAAFVVAVTAFFIIKKIRPSKLNDDQPAATREEPIVI